jgi:hypothetical protein
MLPSERIRELEIQIHNQQPHLDRVVVCLRAVATYLDEDYNIRKECSECKHPDGYKNSHYPTCPLINPRSVTQTEEGPGQCKYCQMRPSGFPCPKHTNEPSEEVLKRLDTTKRPELPPIVFPTLPLKPEDKK